MYSAYHADHIDIIIMLMNTFAVQSQLQAWNFTATLETTLDRAI